MTPRQNQVTCLSTGLAALLALAAGGMAATPQTDPVRLSNATVSGLAGYAVHDSAGERVGRVASVEVDDKGRARWITILLDAGGAARIASFRAWFDPRSRQVDVALAEDLLSARAIAVTRIVAAPIPPSA